MAKAKKHSTPKKRPTKRGAAKVVKRTAAPIRSNTLDPNVLAIEDFKVAYAEHDRAITVAGAFAYGDDSPAKRKAEAAQDRAIERQIAALYRVVTTKPTTLVGLEELAKFFGEPKPIHGDAEFCRWDETVEGDYRSRPKMFFATLAASLHDIAARADAKAMAKAKAA